MNFHRRKLVHWIAMLAILMASLAPAISQAVSVEKVGHGFSMEICTTDGVKTSQVIDFSGEDQVKVSELCPYCLVHVAYDFPINTTLQFSAPQNFALLPKLFYQSPKPLIVWVKPPSAAPPTQV